MPLKREMLTRISLLYRTRKHRSVLLVCQLPSIWVDVEVAHCCLPVNSRLQTERAVACPTRRWSNVLTTDVHSNMRYTNFKDVPVVEAQVTTHLFSQLL